MTQKIILTLIDDIDGSEADETISFVFDGVPYEIDLSRHNAERFRNTLAPYIENARPRKVGRRRRAAPARIARSRGSDIREWARERGRSVSERGRIPASIIEQYETYHSRPEASAPSPGPDFEDDE
jgi:hypothetical protein